MKKELNRGIDDISIELCEISDKIFDTPEVGLQEVIASDILTKMLEKNGFYVERGIASLPTAFKAVYENGVGGPSFGLLCEYDALENLGHACGHHMQGPSILGAAIALKNLDVEKPFKIVVYGTPAEETAGSKVQMLNEGCFKDIDIALMMHAGPNTTTDIKSLALRKITVCFNGKSAHAAIKPEAGRSALDALLLTFNAVEFLREHVPSDVKMHYTVLDAGGPANAVPSKAKGNFYLRAYENAHLDDVFNRFNDIIKGACLMTSTTFDMSIDKAINGKIPVLRLNELLMDNAKALEAPQISLPRERTGSTDFGSVMYEVPGSCIRVAFVPEGTSSHSQEYLDNGKTPLAHDAVKLGAKVLAGSILDMIQSDELLGEIKSEFIMKKNEVSW